MKNKYEINTLILNLILNGIIGLYRSVQMILRKNSLIEMINMKTKEKTKKDIK